MTFEIILYEGSNDTRFQYASMLANSYGNGKSATVGIENQDGSVGLQVACNEAWITDNSVVHFYHPTLVPTPTRTPVNSPTPVTIPDHGGPDGFGYTYDATVPYEWVDTAGGVEVPEGDDWGRGPYDIGFPFTYYGTTYAQFCVSTNGFVMFGGYCPSAYHWYNSSIPNPALPNGIAAPFWDDIKPRGEAVLRFKLFGSAPNRYLVVEYNHVGLYDDFAPITFEVIFYEGSNNCKFQYNSLTANSRGNGNSATVGIEDPLGRIGLQYSFNQPVLHDGLAILFAYPTATPTPTLPSGPTPTRTRTPVASPTPTGVPDHGGPDAFGYTYDATVAFDWVDATGGVVVPGGDDFCRGPYPIGFTFNYYGVDYTQFFMETNGWALFGPTCPAGWDYRNVGIPNQATPNNIAAAFWDDLKSLSGTTVLRYKTLGAAPNRYLVLEWNKMGHYSDLAHPITFEAIFYEGSNNIKYLYKTMSVMVRGDGRSATVGIENATGKIGLQYSYNQPAIHDNLAILFRYPSAMPTPTPTGVPDHGGPDAYGYTWSRTVPLNWIDARDGVQVPWTTDVGRGPFAIGFPFQFYGTWYDQFYIGKGMLNFGRSTWDWTPVCIPSQGSPDAFIAAFWEDVYTSEHMGHLFYKLVGSAPNRRLVVEWYNVGTFFGTRSGMTFEIVLFEGSSDVLFQYQSMSGHGNGTGRLATIGLENQTGTIGSQVSCRQAWIRDGSAVRFTHPALGGTTLHFNPLESSVPRTGGTFELEVYLENVTNLGGLQFDMTFDPSVVRMEGITLDSFLLGGARTFTGLPPSIDNTAGSATFGAYSTGAAAGPSGSGPIARVTFSPVAVGSTALTFQNAQFSDPNATPINVTTRDGSVTVTGGLLGDVDGDCDVDLLDIMAVAGHWGARRGDANYDTRYDLNNDGAIDIQDIMLVVAHWGETCPGLARPPSTQSPARAREVEGLELAPALSLSPATRTVDAGTTFTTSVAIANAVDLGGFQFTLNYDANTVRAESVALGSFPGSSGRAFTALGPDVNNVRGHVTFAAWSAGPTPAGPNGAGSLAVVTWRAIGRGTTPLGFSAVQVTTTGGQAQTATTTDGAVTVTGSAQTRFVYLPIIVRQ
jgi:hypothetical protein